MVHLCSKEGERDCDEDGGEGGTVEGEGGGIDGSRGDERIVGAIGTVAGATWDRCTTCAASSIDISWGGRE